MHYPSGVLVDIVDVILRLLVEAFHGDELRKHHIQDRCVLHEHPVDVFAAEKLGQLVFDALTSDQAQVFALIERSMSGFRFQGEV